MKTSIYQGAFEKYLQPDLYQLEHNLFLAQFEVMKAVPAHNIISSALRSGKINKNTHIIDSSSGTFALGLAMTCHYHDLNVTIVGDPAMDSTLIARLKELNADVVITRNTNQSGNHQFERLRIVHETLNQDKNAFWSQQYDNLGNMRAYRDFAHLLLQQFGDQLILVGTVGSGGSTSGTIRYLREVNPLIRMVVVDTFGSVLFGLPESPRELRGLGNSLLPKNLRHEFYDDIHWLAAEAAYAGTRELYRKHAIFAGITTGAAYTVARAIAAETPPDKKVIFIGPDDGTRYMNTVYSDSWLETQGYRQLSVLRDFSTIHGLQQIGLVNSPWVHFPWQRRTLAEVMRHDE
ncbi:cysteine synthase family protein [Xenorhabdus bovienii]|uniref:cysteine synthase family protein n=1 Tax=Xenorhabdus bovienii TaxID=40576 RepID=UPI0023B2B4B2|nr:cysteine synthase family protein [Xenorhabdus bovienii]MDE9467189.1 cysteine synthase family protein [Xenorhabdus bovienii]